MTPAYIPLSKPTSSRTLQLVDDDRPFHGWRLPATKSWPGRVSVCPSVCDGSDLVVARSRVYITCCERHIFDVEQPRMYSPPSQVSYPESFGSLLIAYRTTLSFSLSLSLSLSLSPLLDKYAPIITNSPDVNQTHGLDLPSALFAPLFAMQKTFGNAPTQLSICPPLRFCTSITNSFSLPRKTTTPTSFLLPPKPPNASGKLKTNYWITNPLHCYHHPPQTDHSLTGLLLFNNKISKLRISLFSNPTTSSPHVTYLLLPPYLQICPISLLLLNQKSTTFRQTAITNNLIQILRPLGLNMHLHMLIPTITNIVNLSIVISGHFHPTLKESVVSPLLKTPTLD